ncbi:hypothetical protein ACF0H5_020266 [Mactra antiquata]
MSKAVFITGIVSVSLLYFAICDGQPCPGTPSPCYPTSHFINGTCVKVLFNGTGSSWNELQNVCQRNGGRLVWLRSDFNEVMMLHVARASHHVYKGTLVVLGLLSSTVDKVGLFWATPYSTSSYQCTSTETEVCMPYSQIDTCSAIGCCWRNGKCQYPNSQRLAVSNQSVENYSISGSDQRQCVGYQLHKDSTTNGHWVTYDCFQPLYNAVYACEYKCNTAVWPSTTMTDFTYGEENNNSGSNESGETPKPTTHKPKENHDCNTPTVTGETPKPTTQKPTGNQENTTPTVSVETSKPTTQKPTGKQDNTTPTVSKETPKPATHKPKGNQENTPPPVSGETPTPTTHKPGGNQKNTTPNESGGTPKPTANNSKENRMTLENSSSRLINMIFNVYVN